jgi:hypothetical protein
MIIALKTVATAAILALASAPAAAADALSAYSNSQLTAPFGFGGYNAGPATFNPTSNCFGVTGFECRQYSSSSENPSIGKVSTATDLGASTLDPAYLNVLPFSFAGPSVAIFYRHDGAGQVRLKASFKLLADADAETLNVSIFREDVTFLPGPVNLTGALASDANRAGVLEFTVEQAGTYGVHVTRTSGLPFPAPGAAARRDWVGLNLEALPLVAPVPEPTSWALMLVGFGSVGAALRRRPRSAARLRTGQLLA